MYVCVYEYVRVRVRVSCDDWICGVRHLCVECRAKSSIGRYMKAGE